MSTAWKLCAAVLWIAVLYVTLKSWLPAWAPLVAAAGSMLVLALVFADPTAFSVFQWLKTMQAAPGGEIFHCVLQAAGILLVTDLGRDFCRDAGLNAAAGCLDFGGRVLVLVAIQPMLALIFQRIQFLVG